jgi:SAM-dependent methyltransferase
MFHFILRTVPRPILIKLSLIFSKIAPLLYYGNKFEDPISGKTYRKFLPYGYSNNVKRENALCPGSLSLERHRLLWLYLKNKTNFFTTKHKLLHIAPEQCFYKLFKAMPNLEYVTGDYNSPIADHHFDLHHAPFSDNSFDVIFCHHVLEHVEDDLSLLKSSLLEAKPGATILITVPAFQSLWSSHDIYLEHFRRYRLKEVISLAEECELSVVRSCYLFSFLFPFVWIYRKLKRLEKSRSDMRNSNSFINRILKELSVIEIKFFSNKRYGISAMVIAKKV